MSLTLLDSFVMVRRCNIPDLKLRKFEKVFSGQLSHTCVAICSYLVHFNHYQ